MSVTKRRRGLAGSSTSRFQNCRDKFFLTIVHVGLHSQPEAPALFLIRLVQPPMFSWPSL